MASDESPATQAPTLGQQIVGLRRWSLGVIAIGAAVGLCVASLMPGDQVASVMIAALTCFAGPDVVEKVVAPIRRMK